MSHNGLSYVMIELCIVVTIGAGACLSPPGVPCGDEWCSDRELCVSLGSHVDMQQLVCVVQAVGRSCIVDTNCAPASICDAGLCRVARSCAEILQHIPESRDGVYSIAPGTTAPFSAVCDMTRDGGGWTLLLKATGDASLEYSAAAWTNATLLNATDMTTQPSNAKYQSFLSLPVTTLRGELDGFRYTKAFTSITAQQIFTGAVDIVPPFSTFNTGAPNWSTQPYCRIFGVNTPYGHARVRFGWSADKRDDCTSNNTAIGLGLTQDGMDQRGAGYECLAPPCSLGIVNSGGNGLLWAK